MSGFPRTRRPFSPKVLDAWLLERAGGDGVQKNRLRRGLSYMVVAEVLGRLRDDDGTPLFILKGGVAMQLRFGSRARLSQDYDAVFRRKMDELEAVVAEAPRHPFGDFVVRAIGKPQTLGPTGAFRQALKLTYRGRSWGEIRLEASPPEGRSGDIDALERLRPDPNPTDFGLDSVEPVPCMPITYQIAQKIHACTEVKDVDPGREPNERFHDLLDLQLLAELVRDEDWMVVRNACVETFNLRGKQVWPPPLTIYRSWRRGTPASPPRMAFPSRRLQHRSAD